MVIVNHLGSETPASIQLVLCFPGLTVFMTFVIEVGFSVYDLIPLLEINTAL